MSDMSKVRALPEEVRAQLNQRLADSGFRGYTALERWLAAKGYQISKSSIHRYGTRLEQRLDAIRVSTEAARAIAAASPDDSDHRSAAVMSLIQTEFFNTLVGLQEFSEEHDPEQRLKSLSRVAQSFAHLSRASVVQKKWHSEVQARAQAAATAAQSIAKKGGLSEGAAAEIRRAILGIVDAETTA